MKRAAPTSTKPKSIEGFSYIRPNGSLAHRVLASVESAQAEAAFDLMGTCGVMLPRDWDTAYVRGYRVVPVKAMSAKTKRTWREFQREAR